MRRFGLLLALSVLAPAVALIPSTSVEAAEAVAAAEAEVPAAYVKLTLTRNGNSYQHPGFLMAADEEGVFVINCDGKDHEIAVSFVSMGETHFTLSVDYAINGRTQWVEELRAEAGEDAELTHGRSVLAINVDPQGSEDTSRDEGNQIDDPDSDGEDDPLGGLPLRKK